MIPKRVDMLNVKGIGAKRLGDMKRASEGWLFLF